MKKIQKKAVISNHFWRQHYTVPAAEHIFKLGARTHVMGIINATPDSFSADGCYTEKKDAIDQALRRAKKFVKYGADILDIGGESSRPGSHKISVKDELARVLPIIKICKQNLTLPLSIDTYKSSVAKHALDEGVCMINNIQGTHLKPSLLKMVRDYDASIILMHMNGQPKTMQNHIVYQDLILDIVEQLRISIEKCLDIGIKLDRIIVDPGIGFGKTVEHNLSIINHLKKFNVLKCPILVGSSRKNFIGSILNKTTEHRLYGSLASVCACVQNGAHIVRVHDVKETVDVVKMMDSILSR